MRADGRRRPHRLRRPALRDRAAGRVLLPRRVRRLPRLPRAAAGARCAACSRPTGTLYFHIDYREAHYCKLLLDELFGRECFLNELIWAYDYGAKPRRRWPRQARHDPRLREATPAATSSTPRRSTASRTWRPAWSRRSRRARGKRPSGVWWHTIVSPTGREKTGYPTQKPEGIVRRMVQASTAPGDLCLDPFAGSGTLGAVAATLGRRYLLIDDSPRPSRSCEGACRAGARPRTRQPDRRAHRLQRRPRAAVRDRPRGDRHRRAAGRRPHRPGADLGEQDAFAARTPGRGRGLAGVRARHRRASCARPGTTSRRAAEITGDVPQRLRPVLVGRARDRAVPRAARRARSEPADRVALAKLCSRVENDWVGARDRPARPARLAARRGRPRAPHRLPLAGARAVPLDARRLVARHADSRRGARRSRASGYNERRAECRARARPRPRDPARRRPQDVERLPEPLDRRVRHVLSENARVDAAVAAPCARRPRRRRPAARRVAREPARRLRGLGARRRGRRRRRSSSAGAAGARMSAAASAARCSGCCRPAPSRRRAALASLRRATAPSCLLALMRSSSPSPPPRGPPADASTPGRGQRTRNSPRRGTGPRASMPRPVHRLMLMFWAFFEVRVGRHQAGDGDDHAVDGEQAADDAPYVEEPRGGRRFALQLLDLVLVVTHGGSTPLGSRQVRGRTGCSRGRRGRARPSPAGPAQRYQASSPSAGSSRHAGGPRPVDQAGQRLGRLGLGEQGTTTITSAPTTNATIEETKLAPWSEGMVDHAPLVEPEVVGRRADRAGRAGPRSPPTASSASRTCR